MLPDQECTSVVRPTHVIDPTNFSQLLSVLNTLKSLQFEGFETGFRNLEAQFGNAEARRQIEATGLTFFGCHIFLETYDTETRIAPMELIRRVADGIAQLGAKYLILSGGGLVKDGTVDDASVRRKADALNAAGRYCEQRGAGLHLAYHNHAPEFEKDGLEMRSLYRLTDPSLVSFVTDCGWASWTGIDVPAFVEKHHARIVGLHLRDFKGKTQVPLGQGDFPLRKLADVIAKAGWTGWVLNEEERLSGEKPGEAAVRPAREALRQTFGK
jgi:sugar phosphate isomerase/epimerase